MIKLYRRDGDVLRYHEAWAAEGGITEHWGEVGWVGDTRDHPRPAHANGEEAIEAVLARARVQGYEPLPAERHAVLLIEYSTAAPFGTPGDLDFCERLQARMDETLGWTGLGHCNGFSVGPSAMEVCCVVVDVGIARAMIVADLEGSEFGGYASIRQR